MKDPKNGALPTKRFPPDATQGEVTPPDALRKLRSQWDTQLAGLDEPGTADRLRSVRKTPYRLNGEVIAGKTF